MSTNNELTTIGKVGVLLHEMCHHYIFENHGSKVHPHGKLWKKAMRSVGFRGKVNTFTSGEDRFTEDSLEFSKIMQSYNELLKKGESNNGIKQ